MIETSKQPSMMMRYYANIIDFTVLSVPRLLILMFCAIVGEKSRKNLLLELQRKIGALENFDFNKKEHLDMLFYSDYIKVMMGGVSLCIALGFAYYTIMTGSSWSCTLGQRLAKFMVIKKDSSDLGFGDVLSRISFSYIAWLFPIFVVLNWNSNRVLSIVFIILISIWGDLSFLLKRKESVPDLISGTLFTAGKSTKKLKLF